eukprot:COSAG05_NODE_1583_length_4488_cov_2.012303_2_plen_94_part_00
MHRLGLLGESSLEPSIHRPLSLRPKMSHLSAKGRQTQSPRATQPEPASFSIRIPIQHARTEPERERKGKGRERGKLCISYMPRQKHPKDKFTM